MEAIPIQTTTVTSIKTSSSHEDAKVVGRPFMTWYASLWRGELGGLVSSASFVSLPLHSPIEWDLYKISTPGSKRNSSQSMCLGKTIKKRWMRYRLSIQQVLRNCALGRMWNGAGAGTFSWPPTLWVISWTLNNEAHLLLVGSSCGEWVFCFLSPF